MVCVETQIEAEGGQYRQWAKCRKRVCQPTTNRKPVQLL